MDTTTTTTNAADFDYDAWADAQAEAYEDELVGRWDAVDYDGPERVAGRHHDDHDPRDGWRDATPEEDEYFAALEAREALQELEEQQDTSRDFLAAYSELRGWNR